MSEKVLEKDFCMDCGVLLSRGSWICPVCGFDNSMGRLYDIPIDGEFYIDTMESTGRSTYQS